MEILINFSLITTMAHFAQHPTSDHSIPTNVASLGPLLHMDPILGLKQILDLMAMFFCQMCQNPGCVAFDCYNHMNFSYQG